MNRTEENVGEETTWGGERRTPAEDFGRNLVDRCDPVSPGRNQVEDIESIMFKNIKL